MRMLLVGILLASTGLSGCASQAFSMRTLPAETPAANNALAIQRAEHAAASKTESKPPPATQPAPAIQGEASPPEVTMADAPPLYTYDPWERLNRFTYRFNARFDENVFLPVADGYRRIPSPIRSGVHNFFSNLSEVPTVVNDALQLQIKSGARSLGRFAINSIVGIGGLFDFATQWHLPKAPATFATTLSRWGVHPGPFLVLPLLGPSTLRESVGFLGDYGITYGINVADLYRGDKTYALGVVNAVDTRANVSFRYYATGSPFEYETVRFLYMRKTLIEDEALHAKGRPKPADPNAPAGR
jgi:phospholipid-binding lipoprotein MlaA